MKRPVPPRRRLLLTATGLLALLAGCQQPAEAPPPEPTLRSTAPEAGWPDERLPNVAGTPFDLADLRGQTVLLTVWASWCEPCQAQLATLDTLARAFQGTDAVAIVAVATDEATAPVHALLQTMPLPFPVLLDTLHRVTDRFGDAEMLPTTFLIDRHGAVALQHVGRLAARDLGVRLATLTATDTLAAAPHVVTLEAMWTNPLVALGAQRYAVAPAAEAPPGAQPLDLATFTEDALPADRTTPLLFEGPAAMPPQLAAEQALRWGFTHVFVANSR